MFLAVGRPQWYFPKWALVSYQGTTKFLKSQHIPFNAPYSCWILAYCKTSHAAELKWRRSGKLNNGNDTKSCLTKTPKRVGRRSKEIKDKRATVTRRSCKRKNHRVVHFCLRRWQFHNFLYRSRRTGALTKACPNQPLFFRKYNYKTIQNNVKFFLETVVFTPKEPF